MLSIKKKRMKNYAGIILCVVLFLTGCQDKNYKDVQVWKFKQCLLYSSLPQQTLNGLMVELQPLNAGAVYKNPELFKFDSAKVPAQLNGFSAIYSSARGGMWIHTFCYGANFLIGMKLKITNNTNQVLNLKNTKMSYQKVGGDSVMAVTKVGDPALIQVEEIPDGSTVKEKVWRPKSFVENDGSLVSVGTQYEAIYEKTRLRTDPPYPIGIAAEVIRQNINEYKLLGDVDLAIKPGSSYSGLLFFPTLLSNQKFTVSLDNFLVYADPKTPTPKSASFQFKFKADMGRFWLDQNKSEWQEGEPPATKEYFDEGEKKWKMQDARK